MHNEWPYTKCICLPVTNSVCLEQIVTTKASDTLDLFIWNSALTSFSVSHQNQKLDFAVPAAEWKLDTGLFLVSNQVERSCLIG